MQGGRDHFMSVNQQNIDINIHQDCEKSYSLDNYQSGS